MVPSTKTITCGLPQGIILLPLLFIYVENLAQGINDELSNIVIWPKASKLSLNVKKTYFMVFHRNPPPPPPPPPQKKKKKKKQIYIYRLIARISIKFIRQDSQAGVAIDCK